MISRTVRAALEIDPDLADPGETKNLASVHPDKLVELVSYWHEYEAETGTVMRPRSEQQGPGFGRTTGVSWADWGQ